MHEEAYVKIPLSKFIELILAEEREKIREHYHATLGKSAADHMDTYVVVDCELFKIIKE